MYQDKPPVHEVPRFPYPQPTYPQPAYPQTGYPQTGYPQTGYPTPGTPQPSSLPPTDTTLSDAARMLQGFLDTAPGVALPIGLLVVGLVIWAVGRGLAALVRTLSFSRNPDAHERWHRHRMELRAFRTVQAGFLFGAGLCLYGWGKGESTVKLPFGMEIHNVGIGGIVICLMSWLMWMLLRLRQPGGTAEPGLTRSRPPILPEVEARLTGAGTGPGPGTGAGAGKAGVTRGVAVLAGLVALGLALDLPALLVIPAGLGVAWLVAQRR